MKKKIAIIGAGGFGRELKGLIDDVNKEKDTYDFIGFFDDTKVENSFYGFPVLGGVDEINHIEEPICLVLGIGDPEVKKKIIEKINNSFVEFPVLIHPSAQVGGDAVLINEGSVVTAGCVITCNVIIERFVTLNLMCTVGHDTTIKSFCSFMPSVNISGEVLISENVYVGTGAKIINQLEIGKNTIVGAGAVVSKSLPENCTAVGVPAKPIKFH
ncbi:acetyltransferase [Flavobacterium rakeshii]|uniref:acetyltransferase n=1 Tax=Flavobacterium rakeshii TaxID=1038845 RepID=UPI002E7AF164|nr:acetyltransferase [Flavobacterium rakeshii]MEE1896853.1 acetyltransferase [Flavobacterium rakeshii]